MYMYASTNMYTYACLLRNTKAVNLISTAFLKKRKDLSAVIWDKLFFQVIRMTVFVPNRCYEIMSPRGELRMNPLKL